MGNTHRLHVNKLMFNLGLIGFIISMLPGCSYEIRIPKYSLSHQSSVKHFMVGAGKADITPPVGVPLGGHGPAGRVARGNWTRLFARAFHFQNKTGQSLTLVSCDLFSLPAGLRASIIERVNSLKYGLDPERVIIAATHTHHGPANYSSSEVFNSFGGPLPNFDPKLFEFLVTRISQAVIDAIVDAQSDGKCELRLHTGIAVGIQRNRAIAPFYANPGDEITRIINTNISDGLKCPDGSQNNCPRFFAVDPTLRVLEVVRDNSTRALIVFFAVHPTAMTHDSELYSGDLVGIAMQRLEAGGKRIAGFFNGAEGDVSPSWKSQDRDDVMNLGNSLAKAVESVLAVEPVCESDPSLSAQWNIVPRNYHSGKSPGFTSRPMPGAAELGGAEDGRTIFYNYGWRPEARKEREQGEHGVKEPALDGPTQDFLRSIDEEILAEFVHIVKPTRYLAAPNKFPTHFPVAVAKIGKLLTIASIPVEATTIVGYRIRRQLGYQNTVVVGLANEYYGYTVSPQEYNLQQYEGSSTFLGPGTQDVILELLHLENGATGSTEHLRPQTFRTGPKRKQPFGPDTLLIRRRRNMIDEDLSPLLPLWLRQMESRIPRFEWDETRNDDWNSYRREITILEACDKCHANPIIETESEGNILTLLVVADGITRRYSALWIIPEKMIESPSHYIFRVKTPEGKYVCSEPFSTARKAEAPVDPIQQAKTCSMH